MAGSGLHWILFSPPEAPFDVVAISSFTAQIEDAYRVADHYRQAGIRVILGGSLGVCFRICIAYGFTAVAMMVPAMNDFDIALGRNAGE